MNGYMNEQTGMNERLDECIHVLIKLKKRKGNESNKANTKC